MTEAVAEEARTSLAATVAPWVCPLTLLEELYMWLGNKGGRPCGLLLNCQLGGNTMHEGLEQREHGQRCLGLPP